MNQMLLMESTDHRPLDSAGESHAFLGNACLVDRCERNLTHLGLREKEVSFPFINHSNLTPFSGA